MSRKDDTLWGFAIPRGKIVATVAGGRLTVAIKNPDGTDPSNINPLHISFRVNSGSGAEFEGRGLVHQVSFSTNASGDTFGASNGQPFRLAVGLLDDVSNNGVKLALANRNSSQGVVPINEYGTETLNTGTASLSPSWWGDASLSNVPFRLVGFLDFSSGLATAGVFDAAPDIISMYRHGNLLPGQEVGSYFKQCTTNNSGTTTIPLDNTIPQSNEGISGDSFSYTAASPINVIEAEAMFNVSHSAAADVFLTAFIRDNLVDVISATAVSWTHVHAADATAQVYLKFQFQAARSATFFPAWRLGSNTAGTVYMNATSAGAAFGAKLAGFMKFRELMA